MAPAPRPASRTDLPSMAPRPSPVAAAAPAPRPAPPPSRPPVGARASGTRLPPAASRAVDAPAGELRLRRSAKIRSAQRISDCMRELSARLVQQLDLGIARRRLRRRRRSVGARRVDGRCSSSISSSADGSLPAGVEADALSKDVVQETLGTGPLEELLADDSVREIAVARHDRIFVEREGTLTLAPKWFSSPEAVERVLSRMLARAGRSARSRRGAIGNGMLVEARVENGLLADGGAAAAGGARAGDHDSSSAARGGASSAISSGRACCRRA